MRFLPALLPIVTSLLVTACTDNSDVAMQSKSTANRDLDHRPNIILILTDDQGYADVGIHGIATDVKTPNIDQLARDGVRMSAGYATAPQCTPSRAGLMTGKYQQRFGLDENNRTPMPLDEITLADRLGEAGYQTGMIGKWHLEVFRSSLGFDLDNMTLDERKIWFPDQRGFDDVFFGYSNQWWNNYTLEGSTVEPAFRRNTDYRIDIANRAASSFIDRHHEKPFFLFLSHYAPHVPLEATDNYLSRFDSVAEQRRKVGLAMIAAIDDGVGDLRSQLQSLDIDDNTLIFFISDNGAPIGYPDHDLPVDDPKSSWDGSLNDPWVGEKGMLSEGGIRVPYIVTWPDNLPAGVVYNQPVTTLDVSATSLRLAGLEIPADADGTDLIPHLTGDSTTPDTLAERSLYWRFWSQAAIRKGHWKYLSAGADREYLFDLNRPTHETENLLSAYPQIAAELRADLDDWSQQLDTPGIPAGALNTQEARWFDLYFSDH